VQQQQYDVVLSSSSHDMISCRSAMTSIRRRRIAVRSFRPVHWDMGHIQTCLACLEAWCMCRQLRVTKFVAKPKSISRFWALEPCSQADSHQLTSLLGYLNRPASSLGGRKRMGVMSTDNSEQVDLGMVAGSDGSGGIGGIMFCLKDAQLS
jgi:hypothetical protein